MVFVLVFSQFSKNQLENGFLFLTFEPYHQRMEQFIKTVIVLLDSPPKKIDAISSETFLVLDHFWPI